MKTRSITLASAAVAAGMATLAAGYAVATATAAAAGHAPAVAVQKGGTLTVAEPPQTNITWYLPITTPSFDSLYNSQMLNMIFKPLIWLNNKYQIVYGSSIAQNITYNNAGTVYHVFLNKKWKWSDGTPVTAADLMFTWNVIKAASAPNAPSPWPFVGAGTGDIPFGVKSVVENNQYEVTFTLDKPANQQWFIYNGLIQLIPMPAKQLDQYPNNMAQELKYLGSMGTNPQAAEMASDGPFVLKSATQNQQWVLTPNPKYAGYKPNVSKLVLAYQGSNTAEFAALKTGTVNLGYLDLSQYGAKGQLTSMGDQLTPAYGLSTFWTQLNQRKGSSVAPVFDQLYVRQALEMAMDQNAISKDIWHGFAPPTYGPIPSVPSSKFYDPNYHTPYQFNLAKAKKLLEDHGWKMVNGVMTKGSQKMQYTMLYVTGSEASTQADELLVADWAKIGVKVTLKGETFGQFLSIVDNAKQPNTWQMATGSGWIYDGPGWYPTGGQLFATNAPSGTGYSSVKEDQLIAATHQPYATEAQTMKVFFQYEDYTATQLPDLWMPNFGSIGVNAPTVHGAQQWSNPVTGMPQWNRMWVK